MKYSTHLKISKYIKCGKFVLTTLSKVFQAINKLGHLVLIAEGHDTWLFEGSTQNVLDANGSNVQAMDGTKNLDHIR